MISKRLTITVNSEPADFNSDVNLADVLQQWAKGDEPPRCACALNGEFVPRSAYQTTAIRNGDQIDIVQPIGGG